MALAADARLAGKGWDKARSADGFEDGLILGDLDWVSASIESHLGGCRAALNVVDGITGITSEGFEVNTVSGNVEGLEC